MLLWEGCPPFGRTPKIRRTLEIFYEALLCPSIMSFGIQNFNIIEIGSTGVQINNLAGNGCAGFAFYWFCERFGGKYISLDIRDYAIETCQKTFPNCEAIVKDGVEFLKQLPTDFVIGILYLDGPDNHLFTLNCLIEAEKNLSPYSIIVFDDTHLVGYGIKGRLAIPYLLENGRYVEDGDGDSVNGTVFWEKPTEKVHEIYYTPELQRVLKL